MKSATDYVQTFMLDDLHIRGAFVNLGHVWRTLQTDRGYPEEVTKFLGEMVATTLLVGSTLKQEGRLALQLRGDGPISLLVVDTNERLQMRGMARFDSELMLEMKKGMEEELGTAVEDNRLTLPELLGDGKLMLSLKAASMDEAYQSVVPLVGETTADIFDHYLAQSEQVPSRLFLAATGDRVGGPFIQKLPTADAQDADGWDRCVTLAATVKQNELLTLSSEEVLNRLFGEEKVRVFDVQPVTLNCKEDWTKVRTMLRSLGRAEVDAVVRDEGAFEVIDEICNFIYRFDAKAVEEVFASAPTPIPPESELH